MVLVWVLLVGLSGIAVLRIGNRLRSSNPNLRAFQWKYQSVTLVLGLTLFGLSGIAQGWISFLGDLSAPVRDLDYLGVTSSDTWMSMGLTFAGVMSIVTLVVVWLQSGRSNKVSFRLVSSNLPIVVLFSLTNSLTEELIFRVTLVQGIGTSIPSWAIALLSAVLFGGLHYFGQPGRVPGVLMAGFMAWLFTFAIIQTGGIVLAWLIHFIQDVIILSIVFAASQQTRGKTKAS
jgi:membrane protease YdiL (CAAX protease family)